jgi:hypothetical protein
MRCGIRGAECITDSVQGAAENDLHNPWEQECRGVRRRAWGIRVRAILRAIGEQATFARGFARRLYYGTSEFTPMPAATCVLLDRGVIGNRKIGLPAILYGEMES